MSSLNAFLESKYTLPFAWKNELLTVPQGKVAVITTDGKYFVGILQGYDNLTNLIISETTERIISQDEDSIEEELGLYVVRGDLVSCVGLIDEEIDKQINWTKVKGAPLQKTKKSIQ